MYGTVVWGVLVLERGKGLLYVCRYLKNKHITALGGIGKGQAGAGQSSIPWISAHPRTSLWSVRAVTSILGYGLVDPRSPASTNAYDTERERKASPSARIASQSAEVPNPLMTAAPMAMFQTMAIISHPIPGII